MPAVVAITIAALGAMMKEVWAVRTPRQVDAWATDCRRIPQRGNAEPGPWDNERTPYNIEPMRACGDPTLTQVSMMKASQLGATDSLIFNTMGWAVDEDPGPELIIYPNERLAKRTVKTRLLPSIKASPSLRAKYSAGKAESSMEVLVFETMDVVLAGSGSATNVRSTPFRRVKIDDFDLCEESVKEEATQRMGSFETVSTMLVCVGTPSWSEVGIHKEYLAGDQRRYLCPCPHCGTFREWTFDDLVWKDGLSADPGEVEDNAFIRCRECAGPITNNDKPWCLRWGCWLPEGMECEGPELTEGVSFKAWTKTAAAIKAHKVGFPHTEYRITGEATNPAKKHQSYRISSLYSPFKKFGWVAVEFVKSGGRPGRDWLNGKLGLPQKSQGEEITLEAVRAICIPEDRGGYKSGTVPADVLILCTVLDIGPDHAWALTLGYTERMKAAVWVEGWRIESPRGTLKALAPELDALSYPHMAGGVMRPVLYFIDAQHRTGEVYDLCLALGHKRAFPIKGVDALSAPVEAKEFQKGPDGKVLKDSLKRVKVNTNHFSEVIWARLFTAAGLDRSDKVTLLEGVEGETLRMPENVPEAHLKMFTSEHCVKGVWQKKPGRDDNHFLDDCRYGEAGMIHSGGRELITREFAKEKTGFEYFGWTPPEDYEAPAIAEIVREVRQKKDPLVSRVTRRRR